MKQTSGYASIPPDCRGFVAYNAEDHRTWQRLYTRQIDIIANRACDEYLAGLRILDLPADRVPQIPDINRKLGRISGWGLEAVPALIGFEEFFRLLANRRFPVATFIRRPEDLDYLQEPDVFHEIFGHCPLLTNPDYAAFSQHYGELGLTASKAQRAMLARLYWFTIEFGLVETARGLRIYGGGILSSAAETCYALESTQPLRVNLDIVEVFRTPYRIDVLQRIYFKIKALSELQAIARQDLIALTQRAEKLGMRPSLYPAKTPAKDRVA